MNRNGPTPAANRAIRPAASGEHPIDDALRESLLSWFAESLVRPGAVWQAYKASFACRDSRDVAQRLRARYGPSVGNDFARGYLQAVSARSKIPENAVLQFLRRVIGSDTDESLQEAVEEHGPMSALVSLPDIEFLYALCCAVELRKQNSGYGYQPPELTRTTTTSEHINELFNGLGVPFQHELDDRGGYFLRTENPLLTEAFVPAARALADPRLANAAMNFDDARRKLKRPTDDDLGEVVLSAARSVSQFLTALDAATMPNPPKKFEAGHLWGRMQNAGILPGSSEHLVLAAATIRNREEHQRGEVQVVTRPTAEATIAAAAAAITYLAQYLPSAEEALAAADPF